MGKMNLKKLEGHGLQVAFVFLLYISIQLIFRPEVLSNGRLLAEEGSIWWAHSLEGSFFSTLFFIPPMTGYFLFNANLLMIFVNPLPLSWIALATTWASLIIQVQVAAIFLLLTRNQVWKLRISVFSIILFSPLFTDAETFANSINSQTYLALIPILYLAIWISPDTLFSKVYVYMMMFIAFFSGWYSVVLFPLFLLRLFFSNRTSFHKKIVVTAFVALCVQISVFLYQQKNSLLYPGKGFEKFDFREISYDLFSVLKFSLTGVQGGNLPSEIQFLGVALLSIAAFVALKRSVNSQVRWIDRKGFWFFLAFSIEYVLVYMGDASPGLGLSGRYLIVPAGALTMFIAITLGEKLSKEFPTRLLILIPVTVLMIVIPQYSLTSSHYLLNCINPCLSWSENVRKVSNGEASAYYFWPFNAGNPDWAISSITPGVRLAPFQAEMMGSKVVLLPPIENLK
jgi:hypothetical protein